jgi:hypothetical protein
LIRTIWAELQRDATEEDLGVNLPAEIAYGMAICQRFLWENMRFRSTGKIGHSSTNVFTGRLLTGALDLSRLTGAVQYLTDIHDVLRMRLSDSGETPSLIVAGSARAPVSFIDISASADDAAQVTQLSHTIIAAVTGQSFDLVAGSLWRFTIIRLAAESHVICLCLNHLLVDGPSAEMLMSQLGAVYSGGVIAPRPASYAQFATRAYPAGAGQFWVSEAEAAGYRGTAVDAPADSSGPHTVAWRSHSVQFGDDVPILADGAMRRFRWTPYMVHASAYCAALARVFGRSSFVVGGAVYRGDLAPTPTSVGCYLDIAYFLYRDAPEATVNELVRGVRDAFLRGIENLSSKRSIIADINFAGDVSRVPAGTVFHDVWIRGELGLGADRATTGFSGLDVEVILRPADPSCRVITRPYEVWLYSKKLMPGLSLTSADGKSAYIRANMSAHSRDLVQDISLAYRNVLLAMDDPENKLPDVRERDGRYELYP